MKTWEEQGGSAFPVPEIEHRYHEEGMSLRDYFAAKALQGILAYPGNGRNGSAHDNSSTEAIAQYAYEYADAMLEARDK